MGSTITGLQEAVTNNAGVLGNYYHEDDLTDELVEFLGARCNLEHAEVVDAVKRITITDVARYFGRGSNKYQVAVPTELQVDDPPEEILGRGSSSSKTGKATGGDQRSGPGKLWVSVSKRTGFRRLHITGGCWYRAGLTEVVDDVAKAAFNARCDVCWKRSPTNAKSLAEKLKDDEDTSVETDDESSSSAGQ